MGTGKEGAERRVILSLGSNIVPREEYLRAARRFLGEMPGTRLVAESRVVETEPVDVPEAFRHLKFLNQVVVCATRLSPEDFSWCMHQIEGRLGRVRTVRNGPRTIDIDMIAYEGETRNTPELTLPHPRAKERDFVMKPLKELAEREGPAQAFCRAARANAEPEGGMDETRANAEPEGGMGAVK